MKQNASNSMPTWLGSRVNDKFLYIPIVIRLCVPPLHCGCFVPARTSLFLCFDMSEHAAPPRKPVININ